MELFGDDWKGDTVLIRDQQYLIRIILYNTISKKPLNIPFKLVEGLTIEENLLNWWVKGNIVLQDDFETLQRGIQYKNGFKKEPLYVFRQDGRNKLNIKIETIESENSTLNPEVWSMDYDLIIYYIEDLETDTTGKKFKKLHFIDERYQVFSERNIPWSTSTHGPAVKIAEQKGVTISELTDVERKMFANEAIKSIINVASYNTFSLGEAQYNDLKVGFDDSGSIDNPNLPLNNIDDKNWNAGKPEEPDNLIFYTSPANSKVLDDLNFMMDHAKGLYNDPVFLNFGRYNKKWQLRSLTDIFSKSKQIERLVLNNMGLEPDSAIYTPRSFMSVNDRILNFSSGRTSLVKSYKFSPMAPIDSLRLLNRPQHTMDFSTGTYNIFFEKNKAENIFNNLNTLGQQGLYSFSQGKENQLWLNFNKTNLTGLMVENFFANQGPSDMLMVKMLKDSIFLNQALYVQSEGLTLRQPGMFLFMDRVDSSEEKNAFDDRFLGQWLITKVLHFFSKEVYLTDIYSVKVDGCNKHYSVLDEKNW